MDINLPMSPPVNNNIQTSLCDRLDAIVFERIRVANTQLDTRLSMQEKLINKYRQDVHKVHLHQAQKLKREVKKIRQKKKDYVFDDSDISTSRSRNTTETCRQRCLSEPSNPSYCRRYYSHHYNVKDSTTESKKDKDGKKKSDNDFFNMRMRLYHINMMNNAYLKTHLEHDIPNEFKSSLNSTENNDMCDKSRDTFYFPQLKIGNGKDDVSVKRSPIETNVLDTNKGDEAVCAQMNEFIPQLQMNADNEDHWEADLRRTKRSEDKTSNQHKIKDRRSKQKSMLGSEQEVENNEAQRRKSKHAFEKIFAGLL